MTMNFEVPLFFDATTLLRTGGWGPAYLTWNPTRSPHLLVVGATGTGKTYAVKLLLGRIANYIPDSEITLCDFKHDDFCFLDGASRYYTFDRCMDGLDAFYSTFHAPRFFHLLVFDEWASFVSMLDKKEAEDAKRKLATLIMLGRSFNIHVLVSQQRADAAYFSTARDNFNAVIALGNLSRESRDMLFSSFRDEMKPVRNLGEGYMLLNGITIHHVQVPIVTNSQKLDNMIRRLVM